MVAHFSAVHRLNFVHGLCLIDLEHNFSKLYLCEAARNESKVQGQLTDIIIFLEIDLTVAPFSL